MLDLFGLAHRLASTARALANTQELFEDREIANLGKTITEDVKNRHGDASKISPGLLQSYEDEKVQRGGPANSPLLWDGELRDSYQFMITSDPSGDGTALIIGSDNDKALWHEFGFNNWKSGFVPARPVLLPAVYDHHSEIVKTFGHAMMGVFEKNLLGGGYSINSIDYLR